MNRLFLWIPRDPCKKPQFTPGYHIFQNLGFGVISGGLFITSIPPILVFPVSNKIFHIQNHLAGVADVGAGVGVGVAGGT